MPTPHDLLDVGVRISRSHDGGAQHHEHHLDDDSPIVNVHINSRNDRVHLQDQPALPRYVTLGAGRTHPAMAILMQITEEAKDARASQTIAELPPQDYHPERPYTHHHGYLLALKTAALSSTTQAILHSQCIGFHDGFTIITGQNRDQARFTQKAISSAIEASHQMIDRYSETGELPDFV